VEPVFSHERIVLQPVQPDMDFDSDLRIMDLYSAVDGLGTCLVPARALVRSKHKFDYDVLQEMNTSLHGVGGEHTMNR